QVRLVAGLKAMSEAQAATSGPTGAAESTATAPATTGPATTGPATTAPTTIAATTARSTPIRSNGFTNESLGWKAWLNVIDVSQATPAQLAVLKESHPKAMESDYYRLLVHQPEILRQRSIAFNAIMYAPGGLPRAERELAATVVSRVNGCVFCASVHAQRFEQLARRDDVIEQVFDDPEATGTSDRERAIARFSIDSTRSPDAVDLDSVRELREAGLDEAESLDLLHSVAIFAWANRLMLNLGEPEFPGGTG
ncbi:MAG: peroxidase-related enzyme, partial [Gammaproteobacteria bacterium]